MNKFNIVCAYCTSNKENGKIYLNIFDAEERIELELGEVLDIISIEDDSGTHLMTGDFKVLNHIRASRGGCHVIELSDLNVYSTMPSHVDKQYLAAAQDIIVNGSYSENRTAINTFKLFGHMMKFDMRKGFPLITSKKLNPDNIAKELCFFFRGESNIASLKDNGCNIWNAWANKDGELGPVYGVVWTAWEDTRIINGTDDLTLGFLNEQGYKLAASFDESEKMDKLLATAINDKSISKEEFSKVLSLHSVEHKIILGKDMFEYKSGSNEIWIMFNTFAVSILNYVESVDQYYAALNELGIEGNYEESNYVLNKKINQLDGVMESLINNPDDRRMMVTALNPGLTPVTTRKLTLEGRRDLWISKAVVEYLADENWCNDVAGNEDVDTDYNAIALEYAECAFIDSTPIHLRSEDEIWTPMTNAKHLEIALEFLGVCSVIPFSPSENATVGQQALPPCHMMFQLGTTKIPASERIEIWKEDKLSLYLDDASWLAEAERQHAIDHIDPLTRAKDIIDEQWANIQLDYADTSGVCEYYLNSDKVPQHYLDMTMYQRKQHCALAA